MKKFYFYSLFALLLNSCYQGETADLIIHNAKIYACDEGFHTYEAMAIKDGKILQLGPEREIMNGYDCDNIIDAELKAVFPGFQDAHCHFSGYAKGLANVDLKGCQSFEEVIERIVKFDSEKNLDIILGRGWDHTLWVENEFPVNDTLNILFPDKPVFLSRVDGHSALVNQKALDMANITDTTTVDGGIFKRDEDGLTGLLVDNAIDIVRAAMPEIDKSKLLELMQEAEYNLFQVGLTSVSEAGITPEMRELYLEWYSAGLLTIKNYAMLDPSKDNLAFASKNGIYDENNLTIRSFKLYADGSMGSRGACLIEPYSDDPGNHGMMLNTRDFLYEVSDLAKEIGYQVNTHAIGDSANRIMLEIYQQLVEEVNDHRWRIEHAQMLHPDDFRYFKDVRVLPSVQPTHCTSDMRWVEDRVGKHRAPYAYAYKTMLKYVDRIALGTDFPVEDISPLKTFYAAITRQDAEGHPEGGFYGNEVLSRREALLGMTLWAAYSGFQEHEKGSLEEGKTADFIILTKDIMTIPEKEILNTYVERTFLDGLEVYYSD